MALERQINDIKAIIAQGRARVIRELQKLDPENGNPLVTMVIDDVIEDVINRKVSSKQVDIVWKKLNS